MDFHIKETNDTSFSTDNFLNIDNSILKLENANKKRWKYANMLLPSVFIIGFGFFRMRREKNQSEMLKKIYD